MTPVDIVPFVLHGNLAPDASGGNTMPNSSYEQMKETKGLEPHAEHRLNTAARRYLEGGDA